MTTLTPFEDPDAIYDQVILVFLKESPPFSLFPMSWTCPSGKSLGEICKFNLTKPLTDSTRLRTFKYQTLNEEMKEFSVFARVEKGVDLSRAQEICKLLNEPFEEVTHPSQRIRLKVDHIINYAERISVMYDYPKKSPIYGTFICSLLNKDDRNKDGTSKRLKRMGNEFNKGPKNKILKMGAKKEISIQSQKKKTSFQLEASDKLRQKDEMKEMVKNAVLEVYKEVIAPQINDMKSKLDSFVEQYNKDMSDIKSKPGRDQTIKLCQEIKDLISNVSIIDSGILRKELATQVTTGDSLSQAIGIISRPLPWDLMGPGADVYFANKFVQDLIVQMLVPSFKNDALMGRKYCISRVSFTKLFTTCAAAHMTHKNPSKWTNTYFFKRPLPPSILRLVEYKLLPCLRESLKERQEIILDSISTIKDKMSEIMTNSRTRFIRAAFTRSPTIDGAVQALFNVDLEFYTNNCHLLDSRVVPSTFEEYTAELHKRSEYREAVEAQTAKSREAVEKHPTPEEIFETLRGPHCHYVWSVRDIVKLIVAAGFLLNKNVEEMEYDPVPKVPLLDKVHQQVCDEYKGRYEVLIQEFVGINAKVSSAGNAHAQKSNLTSPKQNKKKLENSESSSEEDAQEVYFHGFLDKFDDSNSNASNLVIPPPMSP